MKRWLVAFGLIVGFCAGMLVLSLTDQAQFRDRCAAVGGHVQKLSRDQLCLTDDGRVIRLAP